MRIIIEGPDGAGKTNFIKKLLKRHPTFEKAERFASSKHGPHPDLALRVEQDLRPKLDESKRVLIYDRHPLVSELIYGPMIRGYVASQFDDPNWLSERFLAWQRMSRRLVFCLPPKQTVVDNVAVNHQDTEFQKKVFKNIQGIYDLYAARLALAMADSHTGVIWWDYTNPSNREAIDHYFDVIARSQEISNDG